MKAFYDEKFRVLSADDIFSSKFKQLDCVDYSHIYILKNSLILKSNVKITENIDHLKEKYANKGFGTH
jgi:hypothetical protein